MAELIELADGLFVRQAVDNMGWADMGGWALVIDALEQADLASEVRIAMGRTVGVQSVRFVLNTHTHGDHVALNPWFAREFGAQVINARTASIPAKGRSFRGDRRECWVHAQPCHTAQDCVIWFPGDRILFAGDLFGWGLIPWEGNLRPDKQAQVVETYRRLIGFGAKHVVPGHGPLCTTDHLQRWLAYFDELRERVRDGIERGLSDDEIARAVVPPPDMTDWWRFLQWKHADSLKKVLKAGRSGWL
ncbi:MAG: MBL fold metallo-hydrolase [Kiritimatiellaeota bacterium]|nr:MBL fold metallo-hydrolase [Kiritimatiellota bacterium]